MTAGKDGLRLPGTWQRHPADLARCVLAIAVGVTTIAVARTDPAAARRLASDLVRLFAHLPDTVSRVIVGLLQVAALVTPLAAILWFRRGRWIELAVAATAAGLAAIGAALLDGWLRTAIPPQVLFGSSQPSWVTGSAFPSGAYLAGVAAAVTTIAPALTVSWRRVARGTVLLVAFARVITAVEVPLNLIAIMSLGVAVGAGLLYTLGSPPRLPSPDSLAAALAAAGLTAEALVPATSSTHGPVFTAVTPDGSVFIKVVGRDERDADLMSRLVRWLRVKGVEDDRPRSRRATVEHEALNSLMAANAGVRVPRVRAVGGMSDGGAFIAFEQIEGVPLTATSSDDITDALLEASFGQLALLHRARIAHRWASLEHFVAQPDGGITMLDFRWAELAATDAQLAGDLAELLASASAVASPERVVAAAATAYSSAQLATALPALQPLAVSISTQRVIRRNKELLPATRAEVQRVAGVEKYELIPLQRLTLRKVIGFLALLVLGNMLLGFVANFGEIWKVMKGANLATLPVMIALVALSFTGGALSLMGAVNIRLPFFRTVVIMFAQSFLNRFIPANAGGMALRARYLQRSGVELVVAAGSVGLTSAASGVMQVVMVVMFFAWAGSVAEAGNTFSLPSGELVLVVIVLVLAVVGAIAASSFGKRHITQVREQVKVLWTELLKLAKQPSKLLLLFGGAFVSKVLAIVMLAVSLHAFGLSVHFAQLGAMYITATTIAAAAPTPGGVGAIEAALAAGLAGLGFDPAVAVAVVVYFRLMTYWFPVLPCWLALTYVRRADLA